MRFTGKVLGTGRFKESRSQAILIIRPYRFEDGTPITPEAISFALGAAGFEDGKKVRITIEEE